MQKFLAIFITGNILTRCMQKLGYILKVGTVLTHILRVTNMLSIIIDGNNNRQIISDKVKKQGYIFLLFWSLFSIISSPVYASPPWLTEGFYAKYNIESATFIPIESFKDPYNPQFTYIIENVTGTFFWKVEEIRGSSAVITVNFSVKGDAINLKSGKFTHVNLSRSFHLLVDINSRFILNTTRTDPFYFPYWVPIGTKAGEEVFIGHQMLENTWIIGKFYPYGGETIYTNWKSFSKNDVIFLCTDNMTGFRHLNPYVFLSPTFNALYERETGILIKIDFEPLITRFLNIFANIPFPEMVLDHIGIEPVRTTNSSSMKPLQTSSNILVSSIIFPSHVEVGKEFELSITIFNNSTLRTGSLKALMYPLNRSVSVLSAKEIEIGELRGLESREVKWRIMLQSEDEYVLRFEVVDDNTVLLEKNITVKGKLSHLKGEWLFLGITIALIIALSSIVLWRRRRNAYFKMV